MKTDIFSFSSRGGRENNEDFCRYVAEDNRCVFALADGLGGHDLGEVASEIAVDTAISLLENPEENSIAKPEIWRQIFPDGINTENKHPHNMEIKKYMLQSSTV